MDRTRCILLSITLTSLVSCAARQAPVDEPTSGNRGLLLAEAAPVHTGTLAQAVVDGVVQDELSSIRACYEQGLARDPELSGKLEVKFVIGADGRVSSATTKSSTLGDPEVESCVNFRFMMMRFPPPEGGGIVVASHPFTFAPG